MLGSIGRRWHESTQSGTRLEFFDKSLKISYMQAAERTGLPAG
jgi:hypothetical protein